MILVVRQSVHYLSTVVLVEMMIQTFTFEDYNLGSTGLFPSLHSVLSK